MNFDRMLVADVLRTRPDTAITVKFIAVGSAAVHIVNTFVDASDAASRTPQTDQLGIEKYLRVDSDTISITSIEQLAIVPIQSHGDNSKNTFALFSTLHHTERCGQSDQQSGNPSHLRSCAFQPYVRDERDFLARWIEDSIQVSIVDQPKTVIPLLLVEVDSIAAAVVPQILRSLQSANNKNRYHNAVVTLPLVMMVRSFTGNDDRGIPSLINALVTQAEILNLANQQTMRSFAWEAKQSNRYFAESCFLMPGQSARSVSTYVEFFSKIFSDTTTFEEFLTELSTSIRIPTRTDIAAASFPCIEISPTGPVQVLGIDDADTPFELIQQELLNQEGPSLPRSEFIDRELQSLGWLGESMMSALPMRDNYIHDALRGFLMGLIQLSEDQQQFDFDLLEQSLELLRINLLRSMVTYGTYGFRESEAFEWMTSLNIERCEVWRNRSLQTTDDEFELTCRTREGLMVLEGLAEHLVTLEKSTYPLTSRDALTKVELLRELLKLVNSREPLR